MPAKLILGLVITSAALLAQTSRSVWDGVYTEAQAKRGAAIYEQNCVSCHGPALEGDGEAPPLSGGEPFWTWNRKPLTALFDKIQREMPKDHPGSLAPEASADVLAHVLHFNKFPAGDAELPHTADALNKIRYESKKPKDSKK